jgi:phospholipase/lecithinase/hemolysin
MKTFVIAVFALFGLAQTAHATTSSPFSTIIAFCDSLSDIGNVAGITIPGNAPVVEGYYQETHYSDDIIWIEYLADYWGLPAPTPGRGDTTSLPPEPDGTSWAWGGAEAAAGTTQTPSVTGPYPNLLVQTEQYLLNNRPDRDALFVMWCGADNLLVSGEFGPQAARDAVATVIGAMRALERAGARNFLVVNMPKLGVTPFAIGGGPATQLAANLYSLAYNSFMDFRLALLRADPRFRANLYFANAYTELALMVDTVNSGEPYVPAFFVPGPPVVIDNVTDQALDVFNETGAFPKHYLWMDGVHPTTEGHQIIAGKMLQAVAGAGSRHMRRGRDRHRLRAWDDRMPHPERAY